MLGVRRASCSVMPDKCYCYISGVFSFLLSKILKEVSLIPAYVSSESPSLVYRLTSKFSSVPSLLFDFLAFSCLATKDSCVPMNIVVMVLVSVFQY